jgi:hypothetical protein
MSYIKPQITLPSPLIFAVLNSGSKRRVNSVDLGSPCGKPRWKYSPSDLAGGGGRLGEVWFGSFSSTAYSLLMISPNLHDIWAIFFLILSRCETLVLLMLIRTYWLHSQADIIFFFLSFFCLVWWQDATLFVYFHIL